MKGGKRHFFPGRDTECTRTRSQKHRARKISRSHLINLQGLRSHLVCLYFVSLPTDPFQSLMMHEEERVMFQGLLPLGEKHFQFMQLVLLFPI